MNLSRPFIMRPVMTTLMMLLIAIGGIYAYFHLPINDVPVIEKPTIKIETSYIGAAASTVLNQVTIPLEKELLHVGGVLEMGSFSIPGKSEITLNFDFNANMNEALRAVQSAVSRAESELPRDITRPSYQIEEGGNEAILYLLLSSDSADKKNLETYAETVIVPKLNRVEGVAKVRVFGTKNTLWLKLDAELMAARGIGFNQVIDSLQNYLSKKPLGSIQSGQKKIYLELSNSDDDEKALGELFIGSVRLKDIGTFSYQSAQDRDVYYISDETQERAILFGIQKIRGANTVSISKDVEKVVHELQNILPSNFHFNIWFNKATWIEDAIHEMKWSLLLALILVVLVIYLCLGRFLEALITSVALPLSILGTFAVMSYAHFSLDLLSLLALTLAVGFVVDDAIVVVESIFRHQEKGEDPISASLKGTKQISFTVLSMTLSLIAVFIPILFMGGMSGRVFREFSITLSVAILFSGFISLTLTPLLCSRLMRSRPLKEKKIWGLKSYGIFLQFCLKKPLPLFFLAILLMATTYFLFIQLPVHIFPDEDRGLILGSVQAPENAFSKVREKLLENHHVDNFLDIHFEDHQVILIRLTESHAPQKNVIRDLQNTLNQIPGVLANFTPYQMIQLDFDLGSSGRYKYTLQGANFADVQEALDPLLELLRASPYFTAVKSGQTATTPKIEISIDEKKTALLGLTRQQIQEVFSYAYGQNPIGYLQKGGHQIPLLIDVQAARLSKLSLLNKEGKPFPLHAIGSWKEKVGPSSFYLLNHLPAANIRFSLNEGIDPSDGMKKFEALAETVLKGPVKGRFSGLSQMVEAKQKEFAFLLLIASFAMYIVLGILYESFIHPLTILSSLPFAGLGGMLTLHLFNEPLSLFSSVGFLLLIGIVKKNGIMIVDYAQEKKKNGISPEKAVFEACMVRFRPIMMTTFAAILGALPLTLGSPLHRGLGLVIVGGLIFSQGLTLVITPILYICFEKLSFIWVKYRSKSLMHSGSGG